MRDHENNTGWIHISQLSKKKAAIVIDDDLIMFKNPTVYSKPIVLLKKGKLSNINIMFTITRNGLEAIQKDLGVISNNIANANTNGFKRSRSEFVDMYSKALSDNPNNQSGLGALFQGTQKQMIQGSPIMTDGALDLNISGRGFFILSPFFIKTPSA